MQIPAEYEDEFAFFEAAAGDKALYRHYRDWIESTVARQQIETVIAREGIQNADRATLIEAAMQPFDEAFRKYHQRDQSASVDYPFSEYYAWWARQSATKSLHA